MVQAWKTNRSRCCDPNWRNCSCGSVTASSSLFPPLTQNCYLGLLRPLKGSLLSVYWLVVCGIVRWFLQHSALLLGAFEAGLQLMVIRGIGWIRPCAKLSLGAGGTFQVGGAFTTSAASQRLDSRRVRGHWQQEGWSMTRLQEIVGTWAKGRNELKRSWSEDIGSGALLMTRYPSS